MENTLWILICFLVSNLLSKYGVGSVLKQPGNPELRISTPCHSKMVGSVVWNVAWPEKSFSLCHVQLLIGFLGNNPIVSQQVCRTVEPVKENSGRAVFTGQPRESQLWGERLGLGGKTERRHLWRIQLNQEVTDTAISVPSYPLLALSRLSKEPSPYRRL